jgi:citrate synthase
MMISALHVKRSLIHRSVGSVRYLETTSDIVSELKASISKLAKEKSAMMKEFKDNKAMAAASIGNVTPDMVYGGMRGMKAMVTDTSDLDAIDGIRYRGISLQQVNERLPKARDGTCGLPEGALWLLLTGEIPSEKQVKQLNAELHRRAYLPGNVTHTLDKLPRTMHPMTQLGIGILALQPESRFADAYRMGKMRKGEYWEYTLEDSLSLIAQIPLVAARIYRNTYYGGKHLTSRPDLDWAGNYAHLLGVSDDEKFKEVTRLYLMLHADHEGGNVSAHATHLVGSALSDPYYSWTAGVCGLAGPLHGLANQECLRWLEKTQAALKGAEPTVENITEYAKKTLAEGHVIPGFGHAVLRNTDPRYMLEREFALKYMKNDPLVKLVDVCFHAIPPVLEATGKVKNPYPNVDAHSGVCMKHYGLHQSDYYTVVFAVSRTLGVVSQLVWSRVLGMPIERPKSVTLDWLHATAKKNSTKSS